ncbi:MAG: acyl-CoA desaturase [Planctomycetes bacterium]|nr:acyl-CoA desaturase [Planctomycetota bacterium]
MTTIPPSSPSQKPDQAAVKLASEVYVAVPLRVKVINLVAVVAPFVGLGVAIALLWGWGFSWVHLGLMVGMYLVSIFGVTIGYHRYFTHRSFQTNRIMRIILAITGSMAVEGPVVKWVAIHRRHHQTSDHDGDPHSPHLHGEGLIGLLKGLWHAHMGWLFKPDAPNLMRSVRDLLDDRAILWVDRLFFVWVALGLLLPAGLGWAITLSWQGAILGFIWGGLVRMFFVHHATFSINSICHIWGSRPFRSDDHSTNNLVFGIVGMGEGWHNNHHAFPTSARHGLRWWEVDPSWWMIRLMQLCRLAWNVRVPSKAAMMAKKA